MYIRSSLQIETQILIIRCLIFDSLLFYTRQLDVKEYAIFIHIVVVSLNMIHFKMFNYGLSVYPHFS